MTSKLKVDELRTELENRGLSSGGTKPKLVKRLEAAIRKEIKQSKVLEDDSSTRNKRQRESEDGVPTGSDKIRAMDKFRAMNVQNLREHASLRGISTSGTKKELLERLCADSENDLNNGDNFADQKEEVTNFKEEKLVTATKKGAAVLDQCLPDDVQAQFHVLEEGDDIYDAMLNQTNVRDNNNKFYVIQLLESDDGSRYMVYTRWGRVGVKGQNKIFGPYTSKDSAIQQFESKFYTKTKNDWSDRKEEFVSHPKCYTWLEMDYTSQENDSFTKRETCEIPRNLETKLEAPVAKFISLICNISMMRRQMMEIGYNAEKLPLGKLSKSTISKGYGVLKRIADMIGQLDRKTIEQLSGEFYTVIPHDFGFKKMRDFVIDTPQKLKSKLEMVEALGEIELASKLLKDDIDTQDDPLYSHYQRLNCHLTHVEADSREFLMIERYMKNTHAKTHSDYTVDIAQIFRVSREGEDDCFKKFSSTKNRMLLWHGSRLTNWAGILSRGLRIAPPEAPVTGYMFGKGVYFADMFSKSANYCYASNSSPVGVLLLCEVALGDMAELQSADYNADNLPEGKLSTKGIGATAPDSSEFQTLENGVVVPLGKPKQQMRKRGALLYNEYIVYNVDQIRMRYVIQVNFKY
ncbi:poly [ADP-ribose] polymerase 2-like [Impatiens glandulifera]|uniref:poly [ADP-ribose] polymerase 2-like n=1 Tax=Impatiens glandulifera TaxID=253017 RepID=UPI001FB14EEC|nr:poly [ADP-ribose] polymerase 2-like [Impatiens glandulifera]